jgi:hypothetical protein
MYQYVHGVGPDTPREVIYQEVGEGGCTVEFHAVPVSRYVFVDSGLPVLMHDLLVFGPREVRLVERSTQNGLPGWRLPDEED